MTNQETTPVEDTSTSKKSEKKSLALKELKNRLPIETEGKTVYFTFKDWTFKEEEIIAKMKKKSPSMGRFINDVLSMMLDTVGGEDFSGKDDNQKVLYINQQAMGNVLYMYLYLRYDQMGEELRLDFKCPFCGADISNYITDIGDIDVDCKFGEFDKYVEYKLHKPITLENGDQLVEKLKIGIAKWDVMEKAQDENDNEAQMKKYSYKHSIQGVVGIDRFIDVSEIITKMKKRDIEKIGNFIAEHNGGPSVQAEVLCSKCDNKFWKQIDWSYDHFFGSGSLPLN